MKTTIYDISEKAGVSIATVSRVLNGSSKVKPKTKQKVLDAIQEFGYTPNAFARGLGLNSMNTIGLMCADSSDLYLAKAIYYIEQNLRQNGYNSILCCTGYELERKKSAMDLLMSKRVDSIVMIGSSFLEALDSDNDYIRHAADHVPVMLLNADFDYPNVYCTLCDDAKGMANATNYLIQTGAKDILYLYNSNTYSNMKKLTGHQTALLQAGLKVRDTHHAKYPGQREDLEAIALFLEQFVEEKSLTFDAILTSDDTLAIGAFKYCKRKGLRVPEDISIIGYNNSLIARCSEPELTSVDSRLETLCNQLSKTLIHVLEGDEMPQKTIFSGDLIKRQSTKF